MGKRERRTFDRAFKRMAVELHMSGRTSPVKGNEPGRGADPVRRWAGEFKSEGERSFPGNGKQNLSGEQREILELKKALNEARIEREILKKAAGCCTAKRLTWSALTMIRTLGTCYRLIYGGGGSKSISGKR